MFFLNRSYFKRTGVFVVISMLFLFSCKEKKSETKKEVIEEQIPIDSSEIHTAENMQISGSLKLESPQANSKVSSPLQLKGKAKGLWFFEASAPIRIVDENGKILGESYITAIDDWMTEDFIDFEGEISFKGAEGEKAFLIFERANPSGKEEEKEEYRIPMILSSGN